MEEKIKMKRSKLYKFFSEWLKFSEGYKGSFEESNEELVKLVDEFLDYLGKAGKYKE